MFEVIHIGIHLLLEMACPRNEVMRFSQDYKIEKINNTQIVTALVWKRNVVVDVNQ